MRNSRRKKMLDLRRSHLGGGKPSLFTLYNRLHEIDNRKCPFNRLHCDFDIAEWHVRWNDEYRWIRQKTGLKHNRFSDNLPSHFRRDENQKQRCLEKRMLNKAFREFDWDDFYLPRNRRNLIWKYC